MEIFDVRLVGFDDRPGKDPVSDLARVFGIDDERARAIVAGAPVLVKRGVDEETAERFFHLLRSIDADVRLERRVEASMRPAASVSGASAAPPAAQTPMGSVAPLPSIPLGGATPSLPAPDFDRPGSMRPSSGAPPVASVAPPTSGARDGWFCEGCNATFHESQVRPVADVASRPGMGPTRACPRCGRAVRCVEGAEHGSLLPRLLGAFAYPFQKSAPSIFAGVALISTLASYLPFVGGIMSLGIQAIFYFRVIQITGDGEEKLPTGGEFIDIMDIVAPSVRFMISILVPFIPAVLTAWALGADSPVVIPGVAAAVLLGLAYMPASVMVAALTSGCLGPLNPIGGMMIMTRVPISYALTTFAVGAVLLIDVGVMMAAVAVVQRIPVPFLPSLLASFVGMILPTIACRMLGIFLHQHRHELGLGLV